MGDVREMKEAYEKAKIAEKMVSEWKRKMAAQAMGRVVVAGILGLMMIACAVGWVVIIKWIVRSV